MPEIALTGMLLQVVWWTCSQETSQSQPPCKIHSYMHIYRLPGGAEPRHDRESDGSPSNLHADQSRHHRHQPTDVRHLQGRVNCVGRSARSAQVLQFGETVNPRYLQKTVERRGGQTVRGRNGYKNALTWFERLRDKIDRSRHASILYSTKTNTRSRRQLSSRKIINRVTRTIENSNVSSDEDLGRINLKGGKIIHRKNWCNSAWSLFTTVKTSCLFLSPWFHLLWELRWWNREMVKKLDATGYKCGNWWGGNNTNNHTRSALLVHRIVGLPLYIRNM